MVLNLIAFADVLHMGISACELCYPLLPYIERVGSLLLTVMKKWAAQWAVDWCAPGLNVGTLSC